MEILYLAHHGILGQKWGVRRFQNPDGTLTEAGRKRLSRQARGGLSGDRKKVLNEMKDTIKSASNSKDLDRATELAKSLWESRRAYLDFDNKHYESWVEESNRTGDSSKEAHDAHLNAFLQKNPEYAKLLKTRNAQVSEFITVTKRITDDLLGTYGDQKVATWGNQYAPKTSKEVVERLLADIIEEKAGYR